jgi:HK97 family phage major capsid protein
MPVDHTRDELKRIRDNLSNLREQKASARRERDSAKDAARAAIGPLDGIDWSKDSKLTDKREFQDLEAATARLGVIDDQIGNLKDNEATLLRLLGDAPDTNGGGNHPSLEMPSVGWDGHRLLRESDQYVSAHSNGVFSSSARFGTVVLGQVASREEAVGVVRQGGMMAAALPAASPGTVGTPTGVPPDYRGYVQPRLLNLSLLDLIPTGTTDSNIVNYVQVTAIPGSAAETAELQGKPQEGLTSFDATAPVVTIAGYIKVARQALDDMAGLGTLINTLLPYDVRRRMLNQILAGDGYGANMLGIFNTSTVGAPAAVSGDNVADAILRAMTTVILSDNDPNFVALNPLAWQDLLLMKTTYGQYVYGQPGVYNSTPGGMPNQTIWGLNITSNRLVPQGSPLVGDAMGCTLLVREGINVKTSDSDQDDFIKNRVTVLAETRVAFPIWRPTAFAIAAQG